MKRILYTICAALLLTACVKDGDDDANLPLDKKICGEWRSTSLPIAADIYLELSEDRTFALYQQIGEGRHRLYRGEWNLEGNILTGRYNDTEEWAASYQADVSNKVLTLVSNNDAAEKSTFKKEEIPSEVRENCIIEVKSGVPVL